MVPDVLMGIVLDGLLVDPWFGPSASSWLLEILDRAHARIIERTVRGEVVRIHAVVPVECADSPIPETADQANSGWPDREHAHILVRLVVALLVVVVLVVVHEEEIVPHRIGLADRIVDRGVLRALCW